MTKFQIPMFLALLGIGLVIGFQNCSNPKKNQAQSSDAPPPEGTTDSDFIVEAEYTDPVSRTRKTMVATSNTVPVSFSFYFDSSKGWFEQQVGHGECLPTKINPDNLFFRFKPKVAVTNCKFNFSGFQDSTGNYFDCTPGQVSTYFTNGTPLHINTNKFVVATPTPTTCAETTTLRMPGNQGIFDLYVNCNDTTCQFRRTVTFNRVGP